ncbi:hypothetical protein DER45DRAFT_624740 [Fusarium avenaceum]|nr:hypothetical protein DER45DRAFT_624740 [Fusarium avenaceum]
MRGSRQDRLPAELHRIRERYTSTKIIIAISSHESPTILLQLHVLDLLICQPSPDGVSYGPVASRVYNKPYASILSQAQPENAQTAGHLRRILDMPHTLRQIVLRMEAASGQETSDGETDPYHGLARRARHIERWYLDRCAPVESPEIGSLFASTETSPSNPFTTTDMGLTPSSFQEASLVPTVHITARSRGLLDDESTGGY